jgi:hypothetical protein
MRVLQIAKYMYPFLGGTEQVTRDLVGAFNAIGAENKVICFNEDSTDGEITTRPYEYPYTIEKGGVELKDWKEWWNAIEHPKIYSAVMRSKLARSIFDQAADILAGLEKIPGFRQVRMELDSYNDLSGTIEWEDLKPDYIL